MNRKRQLLVVLTLMGLAGLMQAKVIRRAATTELDAVRFVAFAQSIDQEGVLETVRGEAQQPLFPALVWAAHTALLATVGRFPSIWVASVQWAAAVPPVLTVPPLFMLLRRLVGVAPAVTGTLFFCVLPAVARLGADGLSDSTHLLLLCIAFWAMAEYLERRRMNARESTGGWGDSALWLLFAGLAVAAATLARAEVLVLAAAFGLTLAIFQCLPSRRVPWSGLALAAGCFLIGLALIWGPYLGATHSLAPRAAIARLLGRPPAEREGSPTNSTPAPHSWQLPDGQPASFARKDPTVSIRRRGYSAALARFALKLADAMGYWIGALAVWGAVRLGRPNAGYRPQGRATAADRLVQIFVIAYSVAVVRFCAKEGYLDSRHLLALVLVGLGSAGLGVSDLGTILTRAIGRNPARSFAAHRALLFVAAVGCLPLALIPLHGNRLGHRQAAEWLATQATASGAVLDTQGWTGLYSGRETIAFTDAPAVLGDRRLAYLVLEERETQYASRRSHTLQWLIDLAGERAAQFPAPSQATSSRVSVVVYRWHSDRFRR